MRLRIMAACFATLGEVCLWTLSRGLPTIHSYPEWLEGRPLRTQRPGDEAGVTSEVSLTQKTVHFKIQGDDIHDKRQKLEKEARYSPGSVGSAEHQRAWPDQRQPGWHRARRAGRCNRSGEGHAEGG